MTELRILNVVIWGAMTCYMLSGAWAAATGRDVRRGDPMRLACAGTGTVMVGFNLRWLLTPDDVVVWQLLYALSAGVGVYIMFLAHAYGRGPRV